MLTLLALLPTYAADVDPFRPAGSLASGTGTLQGESPFVLGEGFGAGAHASFAQDLAVERIDDGPDEALVSDVLPVELYGSWTHEEIGIRVEAFAPLYAHVGAPGTDFSGPALGDLRVQANYRIADIADVLHYSVVGRVELPTGTRAATTRRGYGVGVMGVAGGDLPENFHWLANVGFSLVGADELYGVGAGSTIDLLAGGFWTAANGMRIGAEIDGQLGLVKRAQGRNDTSSWHVFAQNRLQSGLGLTVGAGSGLVGGVGAPRYRVFTALTWQVTVRDTDDDGILDKVDACVEDPEDLDGFEDLDGCPDPDNDEDRVLDVDDQCPDRPEDPDLFEDTDGCPDPDNDDDGVLDADDQCPVEPGSSELNGCPDRDGDGLMDAEDVCPDEPGPIELQGCPDRDGDRVPDARDACPDEPIPPEIDPSNSDGCPKLAYLTQGRITIYEKVNFETGRARVAESSFGLLNEVAGILQATPAVTLLEVGGHTDNVGSERFNQRLSQRRAEAVRTFLVDAGIASGRLVAKGYGEIQPIATNRTDTGKAKNRRVEFLVLEQERTVEELPPLRPPEGLDSLWDTPPGADAAPARAPAPTGPIAPVWDVPPSLETDQPVSPPTPQPAPGPVTPAPPTEPLPTPTLWDLPPGVEPSSPPAPQPAPAPTPQPEPAPTPQPAPAPVVWDSPAADEPAPAPTVWETPAAEPPTQPESTGPEAPTEPETPATPTPVPAPAPEPPKPTSAVYVDPSAPPASTTTEPRGAPGKLSVELYGDLSSATVYIDNEPLPRPAPIRTFPILAGEHQVWVQDDATGLDHQEVLVFHNGEHIRLVFPLGAEPTGPAPESVLPAAPPKKKGRRSRKR